MTDRWEDIDKLILRAGPFAFEDYEGSEDFKNILHKAKILVIGAGGLGCEILKDLALSGFKDIHVIDLDTIDISNLNRQFLFTKKDVDKPKATTAANFIMDRVEGCKVTPHYCPIQDFDESFYSQFKIVISGLDNIEARRWLNAMLFSLLEFDTDGNPDMSTMIPLIDGGSEGFKGQVRVIFPGFGSCFECQMDAFPPQQKFPICTIRNTPRNADHCIEYASTVIWQESHEEKLDGDVHEHVQFVYEKALERAKSFNIEGVTYQRSQKIIKNIIPAVASTNAIISAACVNECFKLVTQCSFYLDNYMMYVGNNLYTYTFKYERKKDCLVCSSKTLKWKIDKTKKLEELIEQLKTDEKLQLKGPSIRSEGKSIFFNKGPLRTKTEKNLTKQLHELFQDGQTMTVMDRSMPNALVLEIVFDK
ncbi:nedd8-activating enzyme e1 catalytic subunit [Anaeramoeba flamelloides]|uniref:NEDD8-activating enzyme E1 catalytic subunit n=1 Tax=Anaeramoeba flamelloides TaxID=1746091 RepID=A0AAV7Z4Y0_9EUKA|nr:nedd8-activating enzyme e1 catalytic subunit [Anaeramoeba flamelloides]